MLALFLSNLSYQEIAAPSLKQLFMRRRDKAMEISRNKILSCENMKRGYLTLDTTQLL